MMQQLQDVQDKAVSLVKPVREFGKKTVYFGLGAVGMTADTAKNAFARSEEFSGKLVERGEELASVTRERFGGLVEEPQHFVNDQVKKAGDTFDKYSEQVLTRVHIPTTEDLESVSKKVAAMDRKLDKAIKEAQAESKKTVNGTREAVTVETI